MGWDSLTFHYPFRGNSHYPSAIKLQHPELLPPHPEANNELTVKTPEKWWEKWEGIPSFFWQLRSVLGGYVNEFRRVQGGPLKAAINAVASPLFFNGRKCSWVSLYRVLSPRNQWSDLGPYGNNCFLGPPARGVLS